MERKKKLSNFILKSQQKNKKNQETGLQMRFHVHGHTLSKKTFHVSKMFITRLVSEPCQTQ